MQDFQLERCADVSDMASNLELAMTEQGIEKVRLALAPETHPDFDGENCVECLDPIPAGRLAMGRVRCTDCQEILEIQSKQFAH